VTCTLSRTLRRIAALVRARDPGLLVVKRSARAAIVMPAVFAVGTAVTDDIQVALFASFGTVALFLFVDLGGERAERLRGYAALVAVAVPLIIAGTLCSKQPVLAVAAMALVGFSVLFAGVLSPLAALGSLYLLTAFVLPVGVAVPPNQILPRLAGWVMGAAVALPALLLIWPDPWNDDRRVALAAAARRLAVLAQAHAEGRRDTAAFAGAQDALGRLRASFDATSYRPTGTGPGEMALAKMVSRAEWVGALSVIRPDEVPGTLGLAHVRAVHSAVGDALRATATLVEDGHNAPGTSPPGSSPPGTSPPGTSPPGTSPPGTSPPGTSPPGTSPPGSSPPGTSPPGTTQPGRAGAVAVLDRSLRALNEVREASLGSAVDRFVASATGTGQAAPARIGLPQEGADLRVLAFVDPSFHARALGFATEMLGVLALEAAGAKTPDLGGEPVPLPLTRRQAVAQMARAHLTPDSVWLRNSLRGAAGLAAAVGVAKATDVSHGFWVVLGAMSVLRSTAVGTGKTAMRALAGTVVGFVLGTAIMVGLGAHVVALWLVLPVAVFVAALAPAVVSFTAGQAGFTVAVVILFNILVPTGWSVGLVRLEDVAIGCTVSVVVGFLMWPRGAAAAFGRALCDAYATSSDYLLAAVDRLVSPDLEAATRPASDRAIAAYHRMDDAYRQFISERGAKIISIPAATHLVTGAVRLRLAAHSLATLPLRPIGAERPRGAAMTAAADGLRQACRRAQAWYLGFEDVLAGARSEVPAVHDDHAALRHDLLNAFETARASRDTLQVRLALRLLWADEDLEDENALQHELAKTAQALGGRGEWHRAR
jgi:uncharacterized membrane protein YccC